MEMQRYYIGLIRKEADSDFGVNFPDFPGCVTAGSTLDEAMTNAAEALAFHMAGMIEDGDAIPLPSDMERVTADPENQDAVSVLVAAPSPRGKAVRVNITIDEYLLKAIDDAAGKGKRSEYLANLARQDLSRNVSLSAGKGHLAVHGHKATAG